jgi:hypothetical protein
MFSLRGGRRSKSPARKKSSSNLRAEFEAGERMSGANERKLNDRQVGGLGLGLIAPTYGSPRSNGLQQQHTEKPPRSSSLRYSGQSLLRSETDGQRSVQMVGDRGLKTSGECRSDGSPVMVGGVDMLKQLASNKTHTSPLTAFSIAKTQGYTLPGAFSHYNMSYSTSSIPPAIIMTSPSIQINSNPHLPASHTLSAPLPTCFPAAPPPQVSHIVNGSVSLRDAYSGYLTTEKQKDPTYKPEPQSTPSLPQNANYEQHRLAGNAFTQGAFSEEGYQVPPCPKGIDLQLWERAMRPMRPLSGSQSQPVHTISRISKPDDIKAEQQRGKIPAPLDLSAAKKPSQKFSQVRILRPDVIYERKESEAGNEVWPHDIQQGSSSVQVEQIAGKSTPIPSSRTRLVHSSPASDAKDRITAPKLETLQPLTYGTPKKPAIGSHGRQSGGLPRPASLQDTPPKALQLLGLGRENITPGKAARVLGAESMRMTYAHINTAEDAEISPDSIFDPVSGGGPVGSLKTLEEDGAEDENERFRVKNSSPSSKIPVPVERVIEAESPSPKHSATSHRSRLTLKSTSNALDPAIKAKQRLGICNGIVMERKKSLKYIDDATPPTPPEKDTMFLNRHGGLLKRRLNTSAAGKPHIETVFPITGVGQTRSDSGNSKNTRGVSVQQCGTRHLNASNFIRQRSIQSLTGEIEDEPILVTETIAKSRMSRRDSVSSLPDTPSKSTWVDDRKELSRKRSFERESTTHGQNIHVLRPFPDPKKREMASPIYSPSVYSVHPVQGSNVGSVESNEAVALGSGLVSSLNKAASYSKDIKFEAAVTKGASNSVKTPSLQAAETEGDLKAMAMQSSPPETSRLDIDYEHHPSAMPTPLYGRTTRQAQLKFETPMGNTLLKPHLVDESLNSIGDTTGLPVDESTPPPTFIKSSIRFTPRGIPIVPPEDLLTHFDITNHHISSESRKLHEHLIDIHAHSISEIRDAHMDSITKLNTQFTSLNGSIVTLAERVERLEKKLEDGVKRMFSRDDGADEMPSLDSSPREDVTSVIREQMQTLAVTMQSEFIQRLDHTLFQNKELVLLLTEKVFAIENIVVNMQACMASASLQHMSNIALSPTEAQAKENDSVAVVDNLYDEPPETLLQNDKVFGWMAKVPGPKNPKLPGLKHVQAKQNGYQHLVHPSIGSSTSNITSTFGLRLPTNATSGTGLVYQTARTPNNKQHTRIPPSHQEQEQRLQSQDNFSSAPVTRADSPSGPSSGDSITTLNGSAPMAGNSEYHHVHGHRHGRHPALRGHSHGRYVDSGHAYATSAPAAPNSPSTAGTNGVGRAKSAGQGRIVAHASHATANTHCNALANKLNGNNTTKPGLKPDTAPQSDSLSTSTPRSGGFGKGNITIGMLVPHHPLPSSSPSLCNTAARNCSNGGAGKEVESSFVSEQSEFNGFEDALSNTGNEEGSLE